ncbi:MAG TPA: hypothetical protein VHB69_10245, partial [Mycobacteriales bacterium]|nr:hypothetical protein [Mycobacteriales bacterium]
GLGVRVSSDDLAEFRIHRVTVRTYLGKTGSGEIKYADPVTVEGWLSIKRHLVRDANAQQVLSESSFTALDGTTAATFAPLSLVTHSQSKQADGTWADVTGAKERQVITVQESTGGDLITGLDRVKVWLQ